MACEIINAGEYTHDRRNSLSALVFFNLLLLLLLLFKIALRVYSS